MIPRLPILAAALCLFATFSPAAEPAKPAQRFSVIDFGAPGNGRTLDTQAIQKSIDHAAAQGGGTIVIPEGVFTSGALFLKPGVHLHLEKDAVLRGSTRIEDYPKTRTRIEGHFEDWRPALVNAQGCDGLQITGEGTIDGSGQPFWQEFWRRLEADKATKNLDVHRPRLMHIADSSKILVSGITLKDSGFWNLHLYRCRDAVIENLTIVSAIGAPSTDGIDIDSCQDVLVRGCTISVDDDCIAIKGSKGPLALEDKDSPPVERIRIQDCTFRLGHGVVTLGSEATIVRDVVVERIRVIGPTGPRRTNVVRFKLRPDTPQRYENIVFRDITLEGLGRLISVQPWTQYFDLKGQTAPESVVRNITVSNVKGSFESFGILKGHDRTAISNITLENIDVQLASDAFEIGKVENLSLKNVRVNGKPFQLPKEGASVPRNVDDL